MGTKISGLGVRRKLLSPRSARFALAYLIPLILVPGLFALALWYPNVLPRGFGYLGPVPVLGTSATANLLVGLSYLIVSATLFWLVRRAGRDLPFPVFFWVFGVFIFGSGSLHLLGVATARQQLHWFTIVFMVLTAVSSLGAAAALLLGANKILAFVRAAAEAAERRGNERFRVMMQAAPTSIIGFDTAGRINAWNAAAERLFGQGPGTIAEAERRIVPGDRMAEHEDLLQRAHAGEVITGYETVRLRADGAPFPASISIAPFYRDQDKLEGLRMSVEDISARKRAAQELQEKTATLAAVTQALTSFLDNGDWSRASQHLLQFALRQTQSEYGFLGVLVDGPVLRVLAHDGVVWDQTLGRALYEEKMRQQAETGYFDVTHIHNLLGHVITQREPVIANSRASDPRSGALPPGHPPVDAFLGVPISKGHEAVGLIAVANRPGGYSANELRALETMSQATGVLYDNYRQSLKQKKLEDEQKQLEAQMRQAQKMEVLGRLAGGVAHDFNNMLMVLSGNSELLDKFLPPRSPARNYLQQIRRTTEKAAGLTRQLLAFSRKQVVELRRLNLHDALCETETILPRLLGSDIQLEFVHQAADPWIFSDPSQIEQVIANLAINARDAMPQGGHLRISTRHAVALPQDFPGVGPSSRGWILLEVADTGFGMDEAIRAQIFEPFFTTKPVGKGTGLGLSTVYGIVKQSGGCIRVESAPGQGARFELYFPAVESLQPSVSVLPVGAPEIIRGEGKTVLIADDETALRHALVEMLRDSGCRVLEATSTTEALELAANFSGSLDILLTDLDMPDLRGTELARRLSEQHPGVRVIIMSGYAEELTGTQLPPNATFLQKPFPFAALLEEIKLAQPRP
jgi:two-component system cell cycle sensor histidine kinase/response regulator CckA